MLEQKIASLEGPPTNSNAFPSEESYSVDNEDDDDDVFWKKITVFQILWIFEKLRSTIVYWDFDSKNWIVDKWKKSLDFAVKFCMDSTSLCL